MKQSKILLGLKTGVLALCLAASVPFGANATTRINPDGTGLDESKMTEEEKKGYELTKKYSKSLPLIDPNPNIPEKYFSENTSKGNRAGTLESKYDSRTKGVIGHQKDQDITGTCWCFSMLESAEASLRSKENKSADFSEYQLAYFIYNQDNDKFGLSQDSIEPRNTDAGSLEYYRIGATVYSDLFAVTKTVGLINEDEAEFNDLIDRLHDDVKAVLPDEYCFYHNQYTVSGVKILNPKLQSEDVKRYIKEYGAGQLTYKHYTECYDYNTYSFYHSPERKLDNGGGHAVTVVGWDDNYSKENFIDSPKNDGAWLLKNSWGDVWGNDGYFWMSYEEPSIGYATFVDVEKADNYDNIYQYDGTISTAQISDYLLSANVFTAQNDELLDSVSFFTVKDNTKYEVSIYKNPEENKPDSGTLLETQEGTIAHMGYTKLKLNKSYDLEKDDKFSIVVKQTVNGKPATIFCDRSSSEEYYFINSVSHAGESFASKDGNTWKDISADGNSNIRIKAFTRINESVNGSKIIFDKNAYEVLIDQTVSPVVMLDDVVANGKAKLEYIVEDGNIASVDSRGVVTGKTVGETKLTVKYNDIAAETTIKVIPDSSVSNIEITKKNDYATLENPLEVYAGSTVLLDYTVSPKAYSHKAFTVVEALDDNIDIENDVIYKGVGKYIFLHEGSYKVTVSIENQRSLKGSSLEFYVNVSFDSVDCGTDYTKISENPYKNKYIKIFRYSNPEIKSNRFTFEGNIEENYDYLYVFGFESEAITDQEIYTAYKTNSFSEGINLAAKLTGDINDLTIKVPYPNVAFMLVSDDLKNGSYKVKSLEHVIPIEQISMREEDLVINIGVGEKIEKTVALLPEGCSVNDLVISSDNNDIAKISTKDGKLIIDPLKVGTVNVYLKNSNDFKNLDDYNFESGYNIENGIVSSEVIRLTVNVSSDKARPSRFAFINDDNDEINNISIARNEIQQLKLNSDIWNDYLVQYTSSDITKAYVNNSGELIAVSTGTVKIKAQINILGNNAENSEVYKAELTVNVTKPDENDISALQTLHNYVKGTDEVYSYTDSDADTECMNLYFDNKSELSDEDYITIQDGNGYFYGYEDGKIITKLSADDNDLSEAFRYNGKDKKIPVVLTIYDRTVHIHLVSKKGGAEDDMITRDCYGFRIKKIDTGLAATSIIVEDMSLDFSNYRSFKKRLKVTKIPENAIDLLYYLIDDESVATVSQEGIVTGITEGETTCRVYTINPTTNIESTGNISVGGKKLIDAEFYHVFDDKSNLVQPLNDPESVELEVGQYVSMYYKRVPWNSSQDITFDISDENGIEIKTKLHSKKLKVYRLMISGKKAGKYTIKGYVPGNDDPVQVFDVVVTEPEIPENFKSFNVSNYAVNGNGDKINTEITEDDISYQNYIDNESIYWTYKRENAEYVDITFSKKSSLGFYKDWIYIYDLTGKLIGRYTGDVNNDSETGFAGRTIKVPGEGFVLGFVADDSDDGSDNGFSIIDIKPHFKKTEESTEDMTEDKKVDDKKIEEKTTEDKKDTTATPTPTPKTAAKDKTSQIGQTVVVGKATYKILSNGTVAYVKTNVKNPTSASVPTTVKISGKSYKVTEISANAFKNKKKLKKVTIGKNVQKIGNNAFSGCKSLKNITIMGKRLKKVGTNAIKGINKKAVIKVPKTKVKAYKKLFTKKTGYKKNTMKIKK